MGTRWRDVAEAIAQGGDIRPSGNGWAVRCPAHEDRKASLTVGPGRDQPVVLHCFAQCETADILGAVGMTLADVSKPREDRPRDAADGRYVAIYDYRDENDVLLFQVCRKADKTFPQRRPDPTSRDGWSYRLGDTRRVLYRLPKVIAAVEECREIYVVEGEKDVHTLEGQGLVATCNPGGAGKWKPEYSQALRGAVVTIVADWDEPDKLGIRRGVDHAEKVYRSLDGVADSVTIVRAASGKDATDHFQAGHTLDEFVPVARDLNAGDASASREKPDSPNAAEDDQDRAVDGFWNARPHLGHIRDTAYERMINPWALLGVVLARVCVNVGPHVVLPAIVGSKASLNTLWALVGNSGSGKSVTMTVGAEMIGSCDIEEVGTGQGIDSTFVGGDKKPVQVNDVALFVLPEIDTLKAHAGMSGATIMPTLRKIYSGEQLGARYATTGLRRKVRAHHYRAAVIAGVQPGRAGVLLDDATGGTPQRWLWMPTNIGGPDYDRWEAAGCRSIDPPLMWKQYERLMPVGDLSDDDDGGDRKIVRKREWEFEVCDAAAATTKAITLAAGRRAMDVDGDAGLEGHANLTRLKVAALLALLDGQRTKVLDEDWHLAGVVMAVSDRTRAVCQRALAVTASRSNVARGVAAAVQATAAADHAEQTVIKNLLTRLQKAGDWMVRGDLRGRLRKDQRDYFESAIGRLCDTGQIEVEESPRGTKYRARSK